MRLRSPLAVIAVLAGGAGHSATPPAPGAQVTQPPRAIAGLAAPDFVSVTINVKVDLTGLNPLATTGSLDCWGLAVGNASNAQASAMDVSSARDFVHNLNGTMASADLGVLATVNSNLAQLRSLTSALTHEGVDVPGYHGSHANVSFPVANGEYHGTLQVAFRISRVELTDAVTHSVFLSPDALVACSLYLNGRQAVYGPPRQLPDSNNVNVVAAGSAIAYVATMPIPGL